jgi:uncharacterized protein
MIGKNAVHKMTKEVGKAGIDFLFDEKKLNGYIDFDLHKCLILDFIGGEPTLETDLMDYIVDYFKWKAVKLDHPWAINHMINITTNGVLYDSPSFQKFLQKNRGKVSVGLTIDGTKELHDACRVFPNGKGSYDIVSKNAKLWINQFPEAGTKVTLAPENIMYLKEAILHIWDDIGIKLIHANCIYEEGWDFSHAKIMYDQMKSLADVILDKEYYKEKYCSLFEESFGKPLEEKYNENWCGGDGSMLAIGTDGTCYPCIRYMPYSLMTPGRKALDIGNVFDGLVSKKDSETLKCLTCITRRSQSTDECWTCPIAEGCAWCSGYNYDRFGTANKRATFICPTHKARVLANVYFWNKLYKKLNMDKQFPHNMPDEWALQIIDQEELNMLKSLVK